MLYKLTGFFNPTVTHPTFLTPIFLSGNQWYVQELDDNGRILAFHPTRMSSNDLIGLPAASPDIIQAEGEDGYWAFQASATGTVFHGRGEDMTRTLKNCLDDPAVLASPFVYLDVVRFVGDRSREAAALRRVFDDLAEHSREDAEFWRDLSILLPAVKDGLRSMRDDAGSVEHYDHFVRIASVRVEGKTPLLLMGQALYDFVRNRRPKFRAAMSEPNRLARIFDLDVLTPKTRPGGPKIASLEPQPGQKPDSAEADAPAPARKATGKSLLSLLRDLVTELEDDIRRRLDGDPALNAPLDREWTEAREVGRTATGFQEWREGEITQAAVHWVLSAVFVRFLEDNRLIDEVWLSGPTAERREAARDRHRAFIGRNRTLSDRDYLLDVFQTVAGLHGMGPLFDPRHNPVWRLQPTGDGAAALIAFFQKVDTTSGDLLFDLTRNDLNTRFLGDLYQDLSAATRARYALLQTPEFVEEFILDRTLEPAVREFGLKDFRIIDPTCGSGHFLLGAFHRLLEHWRTEDPNTPGRALVQRALGSVFGVDLNPFAVAIARFRLLIAALAASGIHSLADAPDFPLNLAIGDSLLHGRLFGQMDFGLLLGLDDSEHAKVLRHVYHAEDAEPLARILGQQYHAVVGNPPYINVSDKALNQAYRERYISCHGKYALSAPFIERFFDIAADGRSGKGSGYIGLIVSDAFLKRDFGKKIVEDVLPRLDITHIVGAAGAKIPGHGTLTVLLFGRNQPPVSETIRAVLSIEGTTAAAMTSTGGAAWESIVNQIDHVGSSSRYINVEDLPRSYFEKHPWVLSGGGANKLIERIELNRAPLSSFVESIGIVSFTLEDDAFILPRKALERKKIPETDIRRMVVGDEVRDWSIADGNYTVFPYNEGHSIVAYDRRHSVFRHLWPLKTNLSNGKMFGGKTKIESRIPWYSFGRLTSSKLKTPTFIVFSFYSTHNHFVLDGGGKIFNRTAPVIKLHQDKNIKTAIQVVGLLNSSIACYWMKQKFQNRGSTLDQDGARKRTAPFEDFYEFTGNGLLKFPVPVNYENEICEKLQTVSNNMAITYKAHRDDIQNGGELGQALAIDGSDYARSLQISLQEELDWQYYEIFGILDNPSTSNPPPLNLGERAFEIVLARKMKVEEIETTWFKRHGSTPITELPNHWPEDYKRIVERRIELIETNPFINLVERPEYKRRWAMEPWEEMERKALKSWLLDRLEDVRYWSHGAIITVAQLADMALGDPEFLQVAKLYERRDDLDIPALIANLVTPESVPYLPILRYADSGLRKREVWEKTWEKQRLEDEIDAQLDSVLTVIAEATEEGRPALTLDAPVTGREVLGGTWGRGDEAKARAKFAEIKASRVGTILPPPKYRSADFLRPDYWRLRGGLDVAKERFISYPGAAKDSDGTLAIAWAGWDHLQQARALSAHYLTLKDQEGWPADRLAPLLLGLLDLVPWLRQWHNEVDPVFGARMGDYFDDFVTGEARELGLTLDDLRGWKPPAAVKGRGRKKG